MANKLYEESDIADIAEAIRGADKSLQSTKYKTSDMADGVNTAVELSYEKGRKAEYDALWDTLQKNGGPQTYFYAFAYNKFNAETYNPKYPIVASKSGSAAQNIFYTSTILTDTKVDIDVRNTTHIGGMFYNATKLKTVKKLILKDTVVGGGNNAFYGCTSLENIVIEGDIAQSISFSVSPLTVDSMNNIIACLKDFSGTDKSYTITFMADRENMLTDEEKAVATNKGWNLSWI